MQSAKYVCYWAISNSEHIGGAFILYIDSLTMFTFFTNEVCLQCLKILQFKLCCLQFSLSL